MIPSRTFLLLEKALGEPLIPLLKARRDDDRSWDYIAREVATRTGAEITRESLRRWYGEHTEAEEDSERVA